VTFVETAEIVSNASRGITYLTGNDNFILESFMLGATGALIGFGTVLVSEQIEMMRLANAGNFADAMTIYRDKVLPLARGIFSPPVRNYRARMKEALVLLGVVERAALRSPLLPLDSDEKMMVESLLKKTGLI